DARRAARWRLGLGFGLISNLGALNTPRFALESSLVFALPRGWLGARVSVGVGWATQDISDGTARASSRLVLLPIAIGAHYELPLGRFAPYVSLAFLLSLVATKNAVDGEPGQTRVDAAPGLLALGGCAMAIGPGALFLEAGWQQSRLETEQVSGLVGGLVLSGGFRLDLR
ncbi:MAG: hypothetical protein KC503_46530, partial [Myxococcales bacterium]|nr:hypothetical protein [Myxococcales bacterium]